MLNNILKILKYSLFIYGLLFVIWFVLTVFFIVSCDLPKRKKASEINQYQKTTTYSNLNQTVRPLPTTEGGGKSQGLFDKGTP